MHTLWIVASPALLVLVGFAWSTSTVLAEQAPAATQHALEEQANACAQRKPECWTPTSTPTPTASPTPTATLVVPTVTPTATLEVPTATPVPGLPVPDVDALAGYLRPSSLDEPWLELALPTGRWDVLLGDDCRDPLDGWANVLLFQDTGLVWVSDRSYDNVCQVGQAQWQSDVPCAFDVDGTTCSVLDDPVLQALIAGDTTPTPLPTATPRPDVPRAPAPAAAPPAPQPAPPAATPVPPPTPTPVVVVVTATPTSKLAALPTVTPTSKPAALPTQVPTVAPTVPAMPTAAVVAAVDPVPAGPSPAPAPREPVPTDHMPPPMLASFGLLWTRRRVQEETPEWLPLLSLPSPS